MKGITEKQKAESRKLKWDGGRGKGGKAEDLVRSPKWSKGHSQSTPVAVFD
jgi:hypothetical protein